MLVEVYPRGSPQDVPVEVEEWKLITERVGLFAATSTEDFVAEVYAGLVARKTYPAEIMAIYERLKGPPL